MRHLLGLGTVAAFLFGSWAANAQTQNPNQKTLPPSVTSFYANPVMNFYQRQRELREQTNLQRDINQLQKIALEKARRTGKPATDPVTGAPVEAPAKTVTPSVSYDKDKKAATSTSAKTEPKKSAFTGKEKSDTPPMPKTDEEKGPKFSKTFSNYAKMLRK